MSITDCNAQPGGFTGGYNTYGGAVNVNAGATLNLYAGKFYGNTAPDSEGGAIYIQASNKTTRQPGGIFNMYGGEITDNTAKTGAGVRAAGTNDPALAASEINIYGGVLARNHATDRGAAIGAANGTILRLQDCQILDNTAVARAAGFYAQGAIMDATAMRARQTQKSKPYLIILNVSLSKFFNSEIIFCIKSFLLCKL